MNHLVTLIQYRDLLWLWAAREVQVRYKQSLLGIAWAILQPLALTVIFTLVFSQLAHIDTQGVPYPIFTYAALVPWTFFATSLSFGTTSLVTNMNLVTKIYFPREVLPLASIGAALVDFLAASVVFVGMLLVFGMSSSLHALWIIPLLIIQIVLTMAVTLLGSATIVFFRDMRFVIPLVTQVWMYATPVIYPIELVPEHLRLYYFLNPMAGIIDGYRRALLMGQPPQMTALLYSTAISCMLLVLGYAFFKRVEPLFADVI